MGIRGKIVIVTGASAGIGRDTAVRLAAKGATVVAAARDLTRLEHLAAGRPGIEPVRCDVTSDADREKLVTGVLERHGRVDALVNNAGVGWDSLVEDMDLERIRYLYELNVVGLIDLCRLVLPSMLERRTGDIVNVSSAAGYVVTPPFTVYCSTKAAVNAFTTGLRREVWLRGVKVHLINPGPIKTEFYIRAEGIEPPPGSAEERSGGIAAVHVARAIERCLSRPNPFPRVAAVPRVIGLGRLVNLTGVRQVMDLANGKVAQTRVRK